ncbi:MAG: hypothetical protein PUD85_03790 [Bacteroidales bacterium]|nr:hypothetical protein [Bacteroidales bacterium]
MADKLLTLKVLTPEGTAYEGKVQAVFLPGAECPFEVLYDHAPIISTLSAGAIRYRVDGKEETIAIRSGVARVLDNEIRVCADI